MNIKLESDFRDYYDHWFAGSMDKPDRTFNRMANGGLTRSQQFQLLDQVGWDVPMWGSAKELVDLKSVGRSRLVVEYIDEIAHRGEGKAVRELGKVADECPDRLCCLFISSGSTSRRLLCVGDRMFWLEYKSDDDWRSNCGDVSIKMLGETLGRKGYFDEMGEWANGAALNPYPLWAVDFVETKPSALGSTLYAVDFNSAPGISGTGIEDILPAKLAYGEICTSLILNRMAIAQ